MKSFIIKYQIFYHLQINLFQAVHYNEDIFSQYECCLVPAILRPGMYVGEADCARHDSNFD